MDPLEILLLKTGFWVQVHNLFNGMYLESMAKQFGDFIGEFVEYDAKSVAETKEISTIFKYEKLTTFCLFCGRLGHGESFYPIRMVKESNVLPLGWDISLKVVAKKPMIDDNVWLRELEEN
ncbi:hypothetical protein Golax_021210 [Gossypium laxum]|uniref:Zinc knuckle CX2CX4HX4C domain-containing protein n=1 Tax=Gossypium laxum TaxID=34288 RepID=A0A7J9AM52_9ROSI|nr:hypothetical protein [Gossypium laxum]